MRGWSFKGWRLVAGAGALAAACTMAAAATASAATFTFGFGSGLPIPTSPFHVAVGDVITLTVPPSAAPPGFRFNGPSMVSASSSDGAVLAPAGAGSEADGTGFASFKAAHSGTAKITYAESTACPVPNTTKTPTPSPAPTPVFLGCAARTGDFNVIVDAAVQGVSTTVPATGASGGFGAGLWLVVGGATVSCAALIQHRPIRHSRRR